MNSLHQAKLAFYQLTQTLTLIIDGFVPSNISIRKYFWNIIKVKAWVCPYCANSNEDKLFMHDFNVGHDHNFSCRRDGRLNIHIYNKKNECNQLAYQFFINLDQEEMFWEITAFIGGNYRDIKKVPQDKLKSRKDFDKIMQSIELLG